MKPYLNRCVVDGSCMQSSGDIISLQDAYIDAFIAYCQGLVHTCTQLSVCWFIPFLIREHLHSKELSCTHLQDYTIVYTNMAAVTKFIAKNNKTNISATRTT